MLNTVTTAISNQKVWNVPVFWGQYSRCTEPPYSTWLAKTEHGADSDSTVWMKTVQQRGRGEARGFSPAKICPQTCFLLLICYLRLIDGYADITKKMRTIQWSRSPWPCLSGKPEATNCRWKARSEVGGDASTTAKSHTLWFSNSKDQCNMAVLLLFIQVFLCNV